MFNQSGYRLETFIISKSLIFKRKLGFEKSEYKLKIKNDFAGVYTNNAINWV